MPRASPPFDSKDANLVLISSDDVKFRVHRHTISLASSVLSELALAQQVTQPEPSKKHRQRPHVLLSEPSDALDLFLRFIYPIPEPPCLPLTSIATILSLAQRYAAPSVVMRMRAHLMRPEHIDSYPLAVYTLVTSATMMPTHTVAIARSAARRMLPRELPPGADLTGRLGLSGDALCQLLAYRRTCAAAAAHVVDARQEVPSWIRLEWKRFCFLSECGAGCARMPRSTRSWAKVATGYVVVPEWWLEYMEGVRKALATSGRVDSGVARDPAQVRAAVEKAGGCGKCAGKAVWDLQEFACFLERAIEEAIDSVSFPPESLDDGNEDDDSMTLVSSKSNVLLSCDKPVWPLFDYYYNVYRNRRPCSADDVVSLDYVHFLLCPSERRRVQLFRVPVHHPAL